MQIRELNSPEELRAREALLASRGLRLPRCGRAWGAFRDGRLAGTLGARGETLMGLAVDAGLEGEGIATRLFERAVTDLTLDGAGNIRVFTKASEAAKIAAVGFHLAEKTEAAALLEWNDDFSPHLERLRALSAGDPPSAAIVMKADPFTLGHRFLAEEAAKAFPLVRVFVVSEDETFFSPEDRLAMAKAGLADLANVRVQPAGPYMVSLATFPSYFTRQEDLARTHGELDAKLFVRQARAAGIVCRFIGTEPFSPATREYGEALGRVLPAGGIELRVVPRTERDGVPVSASAVRRLAAAGRTRECLAFLPPGARELFSAALINAERKNK